MTLTSFLDVKSEPSKPDETKVDLLTNTNSAIVASAVGQQEHPTAGRPPAYSVEYVELYSYRAARRRRLCRIFAWLLAVFLLLDIGAVLYIGLRMRQHQRHSAQSSSARRTDASSSFVCRLRFRGADGRMDSRTELVSTDSAGRVLMQPSWDSDGRPTILHNPLRGFTLLRAPSTRLCFVKHSVWRRHNWAQKVASWAEESHDVASDSVEFVRLVVRYPAISEHELMSYGSQAWFMCRGYQTYQVEPVIFRLSLARSGGDATADDANQTKTPSAECPLLKCSPCPGGVYLHDSNGCRTCSCGSVTLPAEPRPVDRRRRAAPLQEPQQHQQRRLQIDEGVLPAEDGRSVHIVDVIEF